MRRLETGGRERENQAMALDHLVHPGEALEMMLVKLARLRRAQGAEHAGRVPAQNGSIRDVGEACDRERSCPHAVREVAAGGAPSR
jgi:hypothetical protein